MKAFVINLKKDKGRKKFSTEQLLKSGLDFTLVEAIDGLDLTKAAYKELVDEDAIAAKKSWITKGAIGCALSHRKAYKAILEAGLDYALVVEDDCILKEDLPAVLQEVSRHLIDGEVILLYYRNWSGIKLLKSKYLMGRYALCVPDLPGQIGSAVAYVITRKACQGLVDNLLPIRTSADHWAYFIQENMINRIRCVYPMPIDTADFKSSIDYLPEGSLISKISKLIDAYRIFPFYQLLRFRRRKIKKRLESRDIDF